MEFLSYYSIKSFCLGCESCLRGLEMARAWPRKGCSFIWDSRALGESAFEKTGSWCLFFVCLLLNSQCLSWLSLLHRAVCLCSDKIPEQIVLTDAVYLRDKLGSVEAPGSCTGELCREEPFELHLGERICCFQHSRCLELFPDLQNSQTSCCLGLEQQCSRGTLMDAGLCLSSDPIPAW